MVMVAPGRHEGRARPLAGHVEADEPAIEGGGAVGVADPEVDMADAQA